MGVQFGRREFLSGAMGSLLAGLPFGSRLVFASPASVPKEPILFVMLRGGMDGLNLLAPVDDTNLRAARGTAIFPATGLQIANGLTGQDWRLNSSAPEMNALYQAGNLAFVHAAGIPYGSRSHFEMQQLTESGLVDLTKIQSLGGWLGRYAASTAVNGTFAVSALGVSTLPLSINNDYSAVDVLNAGTFSIRTTQKKTFLQQAYAAPVSASQLATSLAGQANDMINAVASFQSYNSGYKTPPGYGTDSLSMGLSIAAELLKAGAGLQLGAFEYSNWDTHVNQVNVFPKSVAIVSQAVGAFWNDMTAANIKATVVLVSEFGRRIVGNASGGTDHGHGNVVTVLGTAVKGGRMYGTWPGLAPAQTDQGDVAVTTDTRQILTEAINARRGDAPSGLFPGIQMGPPLNLFNTLS